jgi:toxin HigB-1
VYTHCVYIISVIKSFADKETEKVYRQIVSRKLPYDIQKVALRKLIMIDNSECLDDLRIPPANRLEALSRDRKGQYSIRINDKWRICFVLEGKNDFHKVEIVDYH